MLALALFSLSASAQTTDAARVPVFFGSEHAGLVVHELSAPVVAASSSGATAVVYQIHDLCTAPCTIEATPGFHTYFAEGNGGVVTRRPLEVRELPIAVTLVPGQASVRHRGVALQVTGLLVGLSGAVVTTTAATQLDPTNPRGSRTARAAAFAGLAGVGAAFPLMIGGHGLVKRNSGELLSEEISGARAPSVAATW